MPHTMSHKPGLYWWVRHIDETGMSGLGRVAQVAVFEDGSAVLRWLKNRNMAGVQSTVFYDHVTDLEWVHGHGDKQTGKLVPAFCIGEVVMVNSPLEGFSGPAVVAEVSDERIDSLYRVSFNGKKGSFWVRNWEVRR